MEKNGRVKLSALGLAARGMVDSGFGPDTRGTVVSNSPELENTIAVHVDGQLNPQQWWKPLWEDAELSPSGDNSP